MHFSRALRFSKGLIPGFAPLPSRHQERIQALLNHFLSFRDAINIKWQREEFGVWGLGFGVRGSGFGVQVSRAGGLFYNCGAGVPARGLKILIKTFKLQSRARTPVPHSKGIRIEDWVICVTGKRFTFQPGSPSQHRAFPQT